MIVTIKCDGGVIQELGLCVSTVVAFNGDPADESNLISGAFEVVKGTSNVAEVNALAVAFDVAGRISQNIKRFGGVGINDLYIVSDSALSVNLANGVYRCHANHLKPFVRRIGRSKKIFVNKSPGTVVSVGWHRRSKNTTADGFVNAIKDIIRGESPNKPISELYEVDVSAVLNHVGVTFCEYGISCDECSSGCPPDGEGW